MALRLNEDAQCDTGISSLGFSFRVSLGDPETQSAAQTSSTTFEASVSGAVPGSCSARPPPAATPPPDTRPPPAPVCAGVFDKAGECCFTVLNSAGQCCAGTANAASECCPASSPADNCGVCGGDNSCSVRITVQVCVYCDSLALHAIYASIPMLSMLIVSVWHKAPHADSDAACCLLFVSTQADLGVNVEGLEDESFRASFVSRFIDAMAIILDVPKDKLEVDALRVRLCAVQTTDSLHDTTPRSGVPCLIWELTQMSLMLQVLPALQARRKLSSEVSGFHSRRLLQQGVVEIDLMILSPVTAQETVFVQAIADADAGTVSDLTEGDITGISVPGPLGRAGTCGNDVCEVGEVCQGDEDSPDCCIADCPNRLLECPGSSATSEVP